MDVKIEKDKILISLPISPRPSHSGKTTVIASTAGNLQTACMFQGQPVIIGVNAYVKK